MNHNGIFERLAQLAPCAIAVFDREGNVQMWNPAAERLFGWRAEEVLDRPPPIIPDDDSDGTVMRRLQDRKMRGESFRDMELHPVRKDGSSVDVTVSAGPLRDETGELYGSVCVLTDVTDRKRMETELEEAQRRLTAIVRLSPDPMWLKDTEGRYRLTNPAAAGIFGLRPEDAHGRTDRELFDQEFATEIERADQRVMRTGAPFSREITLTVQGEPRTYLALRYPYVNEQKRLLGVIGIARDITDRKRMVRELQETKNRLEALLRAAPVGIDIVDRDGKIQLWNPAAEEIFGWNEAEVLGETPPIFGEENPGELRRVVREIIEEGRARSYRARRFRKDGSEVDVAVFTAPVVDAEGKVHGAVGCFVDVEERKRLEEERDRLADIVQHVSDAILSVDAEGKVRAMNTAGRELLQIPPEANVRGLPLGGFFLVDSWARLWHRGRAVALREGVWRGEGVMRGHNGADVEVEVTLMAHREPVFSLLVSSLTERREAERELSFRALHHSLTGLPNRDLFRDRLAQALARSGRRKTKVAVLLVNLDRFKVINDTLGHPAGDRVLRAVAGRLRSCLREEDTLAHFGGDEFVILLEDARKPAEVAEVAERLAVALREPFEISGNRLTITAGIGFALARRGEPLDDILRNADVAMYRAKGEGAGAVHAYDPKADYGVTQRLALETELGGALERGEFELHWQPVVELASGQACMVEALVRWRHPERGLLAPREFIGVAEESGLIVPLGEWVLETASAQLREWREAHLVADCTTLSVNLSARQLRQPGFRDVVAGALEAGGFEPWRLQLEITESALMESGMELEELKHLGVRLAIDDFGTGYSSLAYLKRFPVDALKIDRTFVEGLGRDPADEAICGAITSIAKSLNLLIVAEGVETPEQLERLKRLGCGWAQGYLLARPMPTKKMSKLLASKRRLA